MSIKALEEILRQGVDFRRRQDDHLARLKSLSAILVLAFIPIVAFVIDAVTPKVDTGTLKVDANTLKTDANTLKIAELDLAIALAGLITIVLMGGILYMINQSRYGRWRWKDDLDIDKLKSGFAGHHNDHRRLLVYLINFNYSEQLHNEKCLKRVRIGVSTQALIAAVGLILITWLAAYR